MAAFFSRGYKTEGMNQYLLLFAFLMGVSQRPALAQSTKRVVSGLVTAREDGSAIAGVLVYVKGTKNFSGTQQDGMYYIELNDRDTILVFEMEGFQKREVKVTEASSLNVTLVKGNDSALRSNQFLRFHDGQGMVLGDSFGLVFVFGVSAWILRGRSSVFADKKSIFPSRLKYRSL